MASNDVLLPYRLRTVRTGVQATYLVVAGLALYAVLPHRAHVDLVPFVALISTAAAGGLVIHTLPWARLFEGPWGMRYMYAWSILDILLITAVVAVSGGANSDLFWIYTLTAFFMAASYPPASQAVLLGLTFVCYLLVLAASGSAFMAGSIVGRFSILGVLTFMASFLSRELMAQIAAHRSARTESERRAALIATVADAARSMSTLDSEHVLDSVVDSAVWLGFEAANFDVFDESSTRYVVKHARGLPTSYVAGSHPADVGMPGLVREQNRTVVVDDYSDHPRAAPMLRRSGFRAAIASPVWVEGRMVAVLVAGTTRSIALATEDIEAFELLAAQASQALENARRFEAERETVERLAELDRLKRDFVSNVSHELRTPLTAILGMGETLANRWMGLDESTRVDLLHRVNANARTLDDVISTLLDFSRLEAGKIRIDPTPVDLAVLVRDLASRLESLFEGRLTTEVTHGLTVQADRQLLERVIENLLSNAAKHTPDDTDVRLSVVADGDEAVVTVTDRGAGIPTDELGHLGERFYRGGDTNTRPTRGTGLGLAFVREVLALHGTELDITSDVGRGSAFGFRLRRSATVELEIVTAEEVRTDLRPGVR